MTGTFTRTCTALDEAQRAGRRVAFFWRDDDATTPTHRLEQLLTLRARYDLPLALAVIPKDATAALAERLASERGIVVWQHGWQHANHAPEGAKKAEFGDHRPLAAMEAEMREGHRVLARMFGTRCQPVFVPPWNRIGRIAAGRTQALGYARISAFAGMKPQASAGAFAAGGPARLDTHLDLMHWHPPRGLSVAEADRALADRIGASPALRNRGEEFAAGPREESPAPLGTLAAPIGILTHHLQHDAAAWATLEALLETLSRHEAAVWPELGQLL